MQKQKWKRPIKREKNVMQSNQNKTDSNDNEDESWNKDSLDFPLS